MKRLLLVGAGHAHAQVLLELAASPPAHGIEVTLVSPAPLAPYSGMVPGWMAGHYRWDQCCIDFAALCRRSGAVFKVDSAIGLDAASSRLRLAGGEQLAYDVLSLDIGSTSNTPAIGLAQVLPMRPLSRLRERWDALREAVRALPLGAIHRIVVVGGGAAGVESLLATRRQLALWAPHVEFEYVLATQGSGLLPALAASAASKLAAHFEAHGIALVQDFEAAQFDAGAEGTDLARRQCLAAHHQVVQASGAGEVKSRRRNQWARPCESRPIVFLCGARTAAGTPVFLKLSGAGSRDIQIEAADLSGAAKTVETADGAKAEAVIVR